MLGLFQKRRLISPIIVCVVSAVTPCNLRGQAISFLRPLGDPNEPSTAEAIAGDSTGIYIATSRTVAKYDANGAEIWVRSFGTPLTITSAAALPSSGIYLTGSVQGSTQPGQEHPATAFLRRYDADGKELWTSQFGGPGPANFAWGVAADATAAYVVASFSPSVNVPSYPILRKYDSDGNEKWTTRLDILVSSPQPIALNASGIYISGLLSGASGPLGFNTFLNKYDFDGAPIWSRQVSAQAYPTPVTADESGIYIAVTDHRYNFVRKYDSDGAEVWTRTLAGKDASIFGLASDGNSLYAAGIVSRALPGQCSAGEIDQFVSRYGRDGTEVWTRQFGTSGDDSLSGIALDSSGIYGIGTQWSSKTPNLPILVKLEEDTAPPSDSTPRIRLECVLNAASYIGGAVAPGEIVTIFGTGIGPSIPTASPTIGARIPTLLAGTRVLFDGTAAPLLYASAAQTTAIVPRSVAGKIAVDVQVEYLGVRSPGVSMRVVDSRIGIFTLDGSGDGQALAVNSDGTVNSSTAAAAKGSVISVYATGGGPTDLGLADDQARGNPAPKLTAPVYALLGMADDDYADDGYFVDVIGAGEIAGSIEGLLRIDLRVPDSIPSGVWMLWISVSDPYDRPYPSMLSTLGPQNPVSITVR